MELMEEEEEQEVKKKEMEKEEVQEEKEEEKDGEGSKEGTDQEKGGGGSGARFPLHTVYGDRHSLFGFSAHQTEPSASLYTSTGTVGTSRGLERYYKSAGWHAGFHIYLPHTSSLLFTVCSFPSI